MSEIIIVDTEPEADAEPEVTTSDVVELVDDAIDHVVAEITSEQHHDDNMALLTGVVVAGLEALTNRVEALEQRTVAAEATADVALDAVAEIADEVFNDEPAPVEDEVLVIPEDEPPATKRSRFNRFWFGE